MISAEGRGMDLRTHPIIHLLPHLPGLNLSALPNAAKDPNQSVPDALAPSVSSPDSDDPEKPTDSRRIDLFV
jgi:hypothetical protein